MKALAASRKPRAPDLFEFFDLDEARRLPCSSLPVFLDYLCSASAELVRADSISIPLGYATLHLQGPVTDDGGRLTVRYQVKREEAQQLPRREQARMWERLEELNMRDVEVQKTVAALRLRRR